MSTSSGDTRPTAFPHTVNTPTNNILVLSFLQQIGPNAVFQDDNARPHRGRIVNDFVRTNNISRMDWPANSPEIDTYTGPNHHRPSTEAVMLSYVNVSKTFPLVPIDTDTTVIEFQIKSGVV
jgi:hypothetical protein